MGASDQKGGIFEMLVGAVPSGIQFLVDYDQQRFIFASGTECGDNIVADNCHDHSYNNGYKNQ